MIDFVAFFPLFFFFLNVGSLSLHASCEIIFLFQSRKGVLEGTEGAPLAQVLVNAEMSLETETDTLCRVPGLCKRRKEMRYMSLQIAQASYESKSRLLYVRWCLRKGSRLGSLAFRDPQP